MTEARIEYEKWVTALGLPEGGIKSLDDLSDTLKCFRSTILEGSPCVFRGEQGFYGDTHCTSSLGRHLEAENFKPFSSVARRASLTTTLLREEVHILHRFRDWYARSHSDYQLPRMHATEWLDLAQHYGAPTRLLDVTIQPLVALFFACWSPASCCKPEDDGILWVKETRKSTRKQTMRRSEFFLVADHDAEIEQGIADNYFDFFEPWTLSASHKNVDHFYRPCSTAHEVNDRIHAQGGFFIWSSTLKRAGQWFPVLVPGDSKRDLLIGLQALQVNPETLFPDRQGLRWNEQLSDWIDTGNLTLAEPIPLFEWEWPGADAAPYRSLVKPV